MPVRSPFEPDNRLGEHDLRSHQPGLLAGALHQQAALDTVGEPRVVADQWARAGLPAGDLLLEHDRLQALGSRIHRRRQTRRAGAHDRQVAGLDLVLDADAERTGQLRHAGVDHRAAVVAEYGRHLLATQAGLLE